YPLFVLIEPLYGVFFLKLLSTKPTDKASNTVFLPTIVRSKLPYVNSPKQPQANCQSFAYPTTLIKRKLMQRNATEALVNFGFLFKNRVSAKTNSISAIP